MNSQLASQGQISRILIADCLGQENPDTVYDELLNTYRDFLAEFGNFHPVDIFVLFDLQGSKTISLEKVKCLDKLGNGSSLFAICVNYDDPGCTLNTLWIQDVLLTIRDNTCLFDPSQSIPDGQVGTFGLGEKQAQSIMSSIPGFTITTGKLPCAGGNLLLGRVNEINYGFTGANDPTTLKNICSQFDIAPEYLFSPMSVIIRNDPHLFHVDRFITIVGSTLKEKNKHLLLFAQPELADPQNAIPNETITILNAIEQELLGFIKTTGLPLIVEKIPLLFTNFASRTISLSFNNSVVENNFLPEAPSPVIYFPKYNRTAYSHVNKKSDSELIQFYGDEKIINDASGEDEFNDHPVFKRNEFLNKIRLELCIEADAAIANAVKKIMATLSKYKIPKDHIRFIDYNFRKPSSRGGALHCLTKVIKRN
ncbi:MAG: hypothetical protein FD123_1687 [Bacteroidetes bacterium]|nr:MAG: hypothetical protein FD123_1687 [Bacteroidota bacterium]